SSPCPVYRVVFAIAAEDLADALLVCQSTTIRARCQVGGTQRVKQRVVFERERSQGVSKAAFFRFEAGTGMVRYQVDDLVGPALLRKIACTIERMKTSQRDVGSIADVMQPSC